MTTTHDVCEELISTESCSHLRMQLYVKKKKRLKKIHIWRHVRISTEATSHENIRNRGLNHFRKHRGPKISLGTRLCESGPDLQLRNRLAASGWAVSRDSIAAHGRTEPSNGPPSLPGGGGGTAGWTGLDLSAKASELQRDRRGVYSVQRRAAVWLGGPCVRDTPFPTWSSTACTGRGRPTLQSPHSSTFCSLCMKEMQICNINFCGCI